MINLKKTMAVTLAMTMVFSTCFMATGCKKKPAGKVVKIEEDSPWYNMEKLSIANDESDDIDYMYSDVVNVTGDSIYVRVEGNYVIPSDAWSDPDFDYNAYNFNRLDRYSMDGELEKSINVYEIIADEFADYDGYYLNNVSVAENINCTVSCYEVTRTDYVDHQFLAVIDAESGDLISCDEISLGDDVPDASNEGTISCGDGYSITKYWLSEDDNYSYILDITNPDGDVERLDLRDVFPNYSIFDISTVITVDDTTVVINPSMNGDEENVIFELDLANAEITEKTDEYEWLIEDANYIYNTSYLPEVGNVYLDSEGIHKIDFNTQEVVDLFDFSMCNVNRNLVSGLKLCDYSEDRIVLAGNTDSSLTGITWQAEPIVIVLTKADSNPNAGKTLLTAATLGNFDFGTCEAIARFNESSDTYFITTTDAYSIDSYYRDAETDEDTDWQALNLQLQAELSNQLAIDLIAGDGPDIIFDAMDYRQLNNSDYLLDLTDYYADSDSYFTNVIDAAKTGNALYQMPLSFGVNGIRTNVSNVDDGQIGFTFDQYSDFVDDVCNGDDPLMLGQLDFFTNVIIGMNDVFETEDGVNYDCDEFREFAEYVKDNVNELSPWEDEDYYYEESSNSTQSSSLYSFGNYISWDYAEDAVLLGIPSCDGRGPVIYCSSSVAISSETASAEGCWEFVETLMSEEIQEYYFSNACPINIDAFNTLAPVAIAERNKDVERQMEWYESPEEAAMNGLHMIDDAVIDNYIAVMSSATTIASMDAAVQKILREEMPAYFSGQKSIDEVIDIIQDKVETYINERG